MLSLIQESPFLQLVVQVLNGITGGNSWASDGGGAGAAAGGGGRVYLEATSLLG